MKVRLLIIGDCHGNTRFLTEYLYPIAGAIGAGAIVQCGDMGYWEHEPAGVDFLDATADAAKRFDIPLYFLRGNHDKLSLLLAKYTDRTAEGFIRVRSQVNYIPDGHVWTWAGKRFRAFGGAYSIDKGVRLHFERKRWEERYEREQRRTLLGLEPRPVPSTAGTLWFPEEQLTEEEFDALMLADRDPVDFIFSHDKPRSADCGIPLKDEPECLPNQDRLQRALLTHKPALWMHGHLHHFYSTYVRNDDGDLGASVEGWTNVVGLDCDDRAAGRGYKPSRAWAVLDIDKATPYLLTTGVEAQDWKELRHVA